MKSEEEKGRDAWGAKAEYMLALIGYAVGIGNIWRFPYLCHRYGGGTIIITFIFNFSNSFKELCDGVNDLTLREVSPNPKFIWNNFYSKNYNNKMLLMSHVEY